MNEIVDLGSQTFAFKSKSILAVGDGILQTTDCVHQAGLPVTHGNHLAEAAGFKRTGHQKKIAAGIKGVGTLHPNTR